MLLPRLSLLLTVCITLFSCNYPDKVKLKAADLITIADTIPGSQKNITITSNSDPGLFIRKEKKFVLRKTNNRKWTTIRSSLQEDLQKTGKTFQTFIIDQDADTTLFCMEGTIITIKQNSFVFESIQPETPTDVTICVREYYQTADILLSNLSTQSNGTILETGGMLLIEAFSQGQKCLLKKGSAIEIAFPYEDRKDGMQLFSGSWINHKINWTQIPVQQKDSVEAGMEETAAFPGGGIKLRQFWKRNLKWPDSLADKGIKGKVSFSFEINETGKAVNLTIKESAHQAFQDAVLKTFGRLPNWKPARRNGVAVKSTFTQGIIFNEGEGESFDTLYKANFETSMNDSTINQLKLPEIRRYVFSTSLLGWINCDRFYNTTKKTGDLYVNAGDFTDIDIKLVFHSFKAILQGDVSSSGATFARIPTGEEVTIVVIKRLHNENFISLTTANTSFAIIDNLVFEPTTMETLRQKLEQFTTTLK